MHAALSTNICGLEATNACGLKLTLTKVCAGIKKNEKNGKKNSEVLLIEPLVDMFNHRSLPASLSACLGRILPL